ncbi:ribonuclease P [Lautropia mirabilis]|nr:ribonuclease P [Lautropia mirabilis]
MTLPQSRPPAGPASAGSPSREPGTASPQARKGPRGRSGPPPVRVSGHFFELTGVLPRPSGGASTSPANPGDRSSRAAQPGAPVTPSASDALDCLQISVPKRLVRAAVRRNTVKRVAREAWRVAPVALLDCGRSWRLRLKAHPMGALAAKSQHARAQMRAQARRKPDSAGSGVPDSPGFAVIKRQLRAELDRLLADAAERLNRRPVGRTMRADAAGAVPPASSSGIVS